jgi:hypothetical protein
MIEMRRKMIKTIQSVQFSNRQFLVKFENLFGLFTMSMTIILDVELPFVNVVIN